MIALAGVTIYSKIYESSTSLVYRGKSEQDNRSTVVKLLKQNYPSSQELTCHRQEYDITRSLDLEGAVKAYSQAKSMLPMSFTKILILETLCSGST
jgi:hypothetical protein